MRGVRLNLAKQLTYGGPNHPLISVDPDIDSEDKSMFLNSQNEPLKQ